MRRRSCLARAAAMLLLSCASLGQLRAAAPGVVDVQPGQALGDATLAGLNGPARRLADFRGKPLVINVWASWCGPCRQEMASLERLAWQDSTVPFTVIGISTDDDPDNARLLLKQTRATISHYIDKDLQLETMLGASRLPLTVLVNAEGRVVEKVYGAKQWDEAPAQALIDRAFRRPASAARR